MGDTGESRRWWQLRPVAEGMKVTRLEIFFDLVFVYALFNVSRTTFEHLSPDSVFRGLLTVALLWWCWVSYVWVGNSARVGEGAMPVVVFAAMAAVFVVAVSLPEAFTDLPGGLSGPLVFAACYVVIRAMSVVVFWGATRGEARQPHRMVRLALPLLVATALLVVAATLPAWYDDGADRFAIQVGLWLLVVVVEYGAGVAPGGRRWRIVSVAHWSERFELVIIIALGELIISVGAGTRPLNRPVTWPVIGAATLGIAVAATLWWAYFDIIALAAELALRQAHGHARTALARDAYVYLHLPMIIGVLLLAVGAEDLLRQVSDDTVPLLQPLRPLGTYLLFGGVASFLLGHLGFQLRILGTLAGTRVGAIVLLAAMAPAGAAVPALAALGILTAICLGLVIAELVILAGSRRALRDAAMQEHLAHEARETQWRRQHR